MTQAMKKDPITEFENERKNAVAGYKADKAWQKQASDWFTTSIQKGYSYNFTFLGRPIIQYPQDVMAMQEVIWAVKPDLIIETGIAHGGSIIFTAGMLSMLDYCDAVKSGEMIDPKKPKRRVVAVDIDIRAHNRAAIEAHPMSNRITMLQGSSIAPEIVAEVRKHAEKAQKVLVILDSNHTHDHVLDELEAYAPMVSPGSYCLAYDTIVEDLPPEAIVDRPWSKGNNPKTAVWEYLKRLKSEGRKDIHGKPMQFEMDKMVEDKLLFTVAPDGYLKRTV